MRSCTPRRLSRVALILGLIGITPLGCGNGLPPNGTQINVTIPQEVAAKQNDAYKDYSRQKKSTVPANLSPGQRERMAPVKK